MIQSFRDLDVWRKSMDLGVRVYEVTAKFPPSETFGLRSQIRRAATSISSNIAEGKAIGGLLSKAPANCARLRGGTPVANRAGTATEIPV
jgi:hypothetical protein